MTVPKFIIVAVLMRTDRPGMSSFGLTTSYRVSGSEDEAVGSAIKWAMQTNPGAVVAGHLVTEVAADDIARAHAQMNTPAAG